MGTIVALATPEGVSAIACIRISGKEVQQICKNILPNFKMKPKAATLTTAVCKKTNTIIDSLIAIYFPAPLSYTGENILELFPHGNPFIIRKLIKEICKIKDVRLAKPGEFTERAFLNGKIDLTKAEALGDILNANNDNSLNNAHKLLSGEISDKITQLSENIKEVSALLELEIDFSEDMDHSANQINALLPACENILKQLQNLNKRFRVLQNEPPRIVLFGAPNAGKSSLINALIKKNRLIVSETAGTTRDFIDVPLHLKSGEVLLTDTAGLAINAQSEIDKQAMQKTEEILKKANLKMLIINVSDNLPIEFENWSKIADLIIETHTDLHSHTQYSLQAATYKCERMQVVSPKNIGIEELQNKLNDIFFPQEKSEEAWITSERQINCIKEAEECTVKAIEHLKINFNSVELAAFEMRQARDAIYSVIGKISNESILNAIFSSYCIGK